MATPTKTAVIIELLGSYVGEECRKNRLMAGMYLRLGNGELYKIHHDQAERLEVILKTFSDRLESILGESNG
jgi:hypothetical protein